MAQQFDRQRGVERGKIVPTRRRGQDPATAERRQPLSRPRRIKIAAGRFAQHPGSVQARMANS
jgi:hypothetical protein